MEEMVVVVDAVEDVVVAAEADQFHFYHQHLIVQPLILRSDESIAGCFIILQSD